MRITAHVQQELEWELEASFTVLEQDASAMPSLVDLHAKAVESALTFAEQCAAYVDDPDKMLDVLAITVKLEQLLAASSELPVTVDEHHKSAILHSASPQQNHINTSKGTLAFMEWTT